MVLVNYNLPDLIEINHRWRDTTFEISFIFRLKPPSEDHEAETLIFCAQ